MLTAVLLVLGWLLFKLATLVAWVYPRGAAVLLIVGAVVLLVPVQHNDVLFSVAVAWLGSSPFSGRTEEAAWQPLRAR